MKDFCKVLQARRSVYGISDASPIPQEEICTLVKQAVLHTPSSFHMQSARAVLLFGSHHKKLWEITRDILGELVPAGQFSATEKKILSFAAGYGTVLFFEETETIRQYAAKYSDYRDNFPIWAQQANGMLQFAVWNLLEEQGLGASLQHYNPLIDGKVRSQWGISPSWQLIAQMPFGAPTVKPGEKKFLDVNDRVRIFR